MRIVKAHERGARDAAVRKVLWMMAPVARLAPANGGGSRNGGLDAIEEFSALAALEEKIGQASLELSAKLRPDEW